MNLHSVSACIAVLFVSSGSANATSFFIRPFSEFTQTAPHIVRGVIRDIQVENGITSDGGKTIYTVATVEIKETLKGSIRAPSIRIRKTGGTKDGVTLEIPSSAEFAENEETVLFLSDQREDHYYEVTGLELGKLAIEGDGDEARLSGGILGYQEGENSRPWNLKQLRELIQKQEASGMNTAPPPSAQNNPASTEAKESPHSDEKFTHEAHHDDSQAPSDSQKSSPPTWAYAMVGLLAVGIFLFFKRRG